MEAGLTHEIKIKKLATEAGEVVGDGKASRPSSISNGGYQWLKPGY